MLCWHSKVVSEAVDRLDVTTLLLESDNHALLENEAAWNVFFDEIRRFILK